MSQPYWPREQPSQPPHRLGLGAGAALGAVSGFVGPIALALIAWAATSWLPTSTGGDASALIVLAMLCIPVVLLLAGGLLMIPDLVRGWGIACLVASGVWLICSAGVCTVFFFGAMAAYDQATL